MPVEVISAFALEALLDEPVGETVLMGVRPRYVDRFIGNFRQDLKQAAYQPPKKLRT
jgi:hypothetical protein